MPEEFSQAMQAHERFLSLQGLNRATAWLAIIIERRIDQFREDPL